MHRYADLDFYSELELLKEDLPGCKKIVITANLCYYGVLMKTQSGHVFITWHFTIKLNIPNSNNKLTEILKETQCHFVFWSLITKF